MVVKHRGKGAGRRARRAVAGLLSLVLLFGLLPTAAPWAQADEDEPVQEAEALENQAPEESWSQEYLDQLVDWGVMRGDIEGNLNPDQNITRAEFVTLVNRAYGYGELGYMPFIDVPNESWYAEDINIAYNMGYFRGTSGITAAPEEELTREQAALLLARNMMLQESTGEVLGYSDSREFSEWSRNMIESVTKAGVITGYPDGTFRPQNSITRGEVACMLVKALGTLVEEPGVYSMGSVYGNMTINNAGVTLRNTTIAGDLYLTGGIGLGDVLLENVTVLGRIVVSGAGESNKGENSIILRNVNADEMIVDSIDNQFVTLRAEGDTVINTTSVRTSAYMEDATIRDFGMKFIELNGEDGLSLHLSGNIKEVLNVTPSSYLLMAEGIAEKITIDEKAVNSTMAINRGAEVEELNMDKGVNVTGEGDVDHLNVRAEGCVVEMLPDQIDIRPDLTANINGVEMNNITGAESSSDPRLLGGYPAVKEIAPTTATGVFSTNKMGTVYWAVTAVADGSTKEEDLITPPVYGGRILQSGTIAAAASGTEYTAPLTGLVSDGSYYLTAVMVDDKGVHSPLKVTAFTTPDDATPAFATGYPTMTKVTCETSQVTVMTNKSCQLYYALLPKNSTAPTAADFKAASVTGNLGYGTVDAVKNTTIPIKVNSVYLEELQSYDLYLWMTDYDGAKSSAVTKLSFTTQDETPPTVTYIEQTNALAASVSISYALSEPGTLYYALVAEGTDFLFSTLAGQTVPLSADSEAAKIKVENGVGALKKGSSSVRAGNSDISFNITGLTGSTAYDLYYVAKDSAGNYTSTVQMMTVNTLDTTPPTVQLDFTDAETDANGNTTPEADTDVRLVFSESVQGVDTVNGKREYNPFLTLYQDVVNNKAGAKEALANELRDHIKLYYVSGTGRSELVEERTKDTPAANTDWVIDYREAIVGREIIDSKSCMVISFPNGTGINLTGGATYYFELTNIADTSMGLNLMTPNPTRLQFSTLFARLLLTDGVTGEVPQEGSGKAAPRIDMGFQLSPSSTSSVDDSAYYDIFLWSDMIIYYDLYLRVLDERGTVVNSTANISLFSPTGNDYSSIKGPDSNGWYYLGNDHITTDGDSVGKSVNRLINSGSNTPSFPKVNSLRDGYTYEFAITLTQVGTLTDETTWSDEVTIGVTIPSGSESNVNNLAILIDESTWDRAINSNISAIGSPGDFTISRQFNDTTVPKFTGGYPLFTEGDTFITMDLQLDRPGTVYYVIAPVTDSQSTDYRPRIQTLDANGNDVEPISASENQPAIPPTSGSGLSDCPILSVPTNLNIYRPSYSNAEIKTDNVSLQYGTQSIRVEGLNAETIYYAYFVLRGTSQELSRVYCFQFTTKEPTLPTITLQDDSPEVNVTASTTAGLYWVLYPSSNLPTFLTSDFEDYDIEGTDVANDIIATGDRGWKSYFGGNTLISPSGNSKITLLDALLTNTTETDGAGGYYSVFDIYANNETKNAKSDLLRYVTAELGRLNAAGNGGEISPDTPDDTGNYPRAGQIYVVNCAEKMSDNPSVLYYFIAAARNAQGSTYSFKAISGIHNPDRTPPDYRAMTSTIAVQASKDGKNYDVYKTADVAPADYTGPFWGYLPNNLTSNTSDPGGFYYEGQLTIEFTEPIYLLRSDGQLIELEGDAPDSSDTVDKNNKLINHIATTGLGFEVTGVKVSGSTVTITYKGAMNGYTILLFTDGEVADASSNTREQGSRLRLTFNPYSTRMADGTTSALYYFPTFTATWEQG